MTASVTEFTATRGYQGSDSMSTPCPKVASTSILSVEEDRLKALQWRRRRHGRADKSAPRGRFGWDTDLHGYVASDLSKGGSSSILVDSMDVLPGPHQSPCKVEAAAWTETQIRPGRTRIQRTVSCMAQRTESNRTGNHSMHRFRRIRGQANRRLCWNLR